MEKLIYCCNCEKEVSARLTDGREIYPHRDDLYHLPFWICDTCGMCVGCHHKTNDPTRPLGNIPSPEIQQARKKIHALLDPIWKSGAITRNRAYKYISDCIGWRYHTAKIRNMQEVDKVLIAIEQMRKETGL